MIHRFLLFIALATGASLPVFGAESGIFGIGFTNVTDTSARLVFTTRYRMIATVSLTGPDGKVINMEAPGFDQIHAVELRDLPAKTYQVTITAKSDDIMLTSEPVTLQLERRPPSAHVWPGYTLFGSSITIKDETGYDLLARSGARMARLEISWDYLFPQDRKLNQTYLDKVLREVAEMKKRGIEPLLILDYCVPWAKTETAKTMTWRRPAFGPPDRLEDWDFYLRTVVTTFRGSTRYYEIWNEPDAGYLATGSYIERPDMPAPIGRPPFKDNWAYWLGDRYVPMISQVRQVMKDLQPDALVMNGGWNRDYNGQRGDLLFERGAAPNLDLYAFHCYAGQPLSFSRWYTAIDGGFRRNIDRIFKKHEVQMPLAITEWGWPAWADPQPGKGFVSFEDAQKFFIKSTFYFLSLQRVEILSQFCVGFGSENREKDPSFFALADRNADGKETLHPGFETFHWLSTTFGSKAYRAIRIPATPPGVKAYAIQLRDSGEIYLAAWQDGQPDDKGNIAPQAAREISLSLKGISPGFYQVDMLDMTGKPLTSTSLSIPSDNPFKIAFPEISSTAESGICLARFSAKR